MAKKIIKTDIPVQGMHCAACARNIEKGLSKLEGVETAYVNIATHMATVSFDSKAITIDDIFDTITKRGYTPIKDQQDFDEKADKWLPILAAVFCIPLFYLTMGSMVGLPIPGFLAGMENAVAFSVMQLILTLPIMFLAREIYKSGFKNIWGRSPNMDSLIAVGTSAAFIYSMVLMVQVILGNHHLVHNLYFESVGVILTMVTLGRYFEQLSRGRASDAIKALMNLSPDTAIVVKDGVEKEIPLSEVMVGDVFVVRPGQKVPVDGIVISGRTYIDEAMITGESEPVLKEQSSEVVGATINSTGTITCEASRVGGDTALAQIISLVREAQGSRPPIANLADKVSGVFVQGVFIIAIVAFIAWTIAGKPLGFTFDIFIAILVIACPCALGLATPMAIIVGFGEGAKHGILYKNGDALQRLPEAKAVLFDKTGTLTVGKIHITHVLGDDKTLEYAAALEKTSEHPIARAICDYGKEKNVPLYEVEDFEAILGKGVEGTINGEKVIVGNENFMAENGVSLLKIQNHIDEITNIAQSPIIVAKANEALGVISGADILKPEAKNTVKHLHNMGLSVIMISGDKNATAQRIAKEVGIDKVFAQVLPSEKSLKVEELKKQGINSIMVGDGINDAPALAAAHVGMAIGGGTDVAAESADVIIKGSISSIPVAVLLARQTMRVIKQNLFWAFGYNAISIPFAAGVFYLFGGPLLNPMMAAAAMALSSISVVANSLRLKSYSNNIIKRLK